MLAVQYEIRAKTYKFSTLYRQATKTYQFSII